MSDLILGIESSCDETAAAVYHTEQGLLGHALHSQIKEHAQYGGVVPELASRDHIRKILPLIEKVLTDSRVNKNALSAIAYTKGPGLIGSLMVGASVARSMAYALDIKAIPVHHMEGHLLAPLLDNPNIEFPFVALLVSGGHTMLIAVKKIGDYKVIGESIDDAAGEAFDKTARLLGLGYPGGLALSQLATKGRAGIYKFPRPMTGKPGLDFSFSGLKTHAINTYQNSDKSKDAKADIALAFETAVAETMAIKCKRALEQTNFKTLVVSGGVSANQSIRSKLNMLADKLAIKVYFPRLEFCTDNAAMIAFAGSFYLNHAQDDLEIKTDARWKL